MNPTVVILCIAIVLVTVLCVTGCSFHSLLSYSDAEKYTAGSTSISDKVESIDIDWISGNVNLVTCSDTSLSVKEETDSSADEALRVHWWLDGTTLRIKYSKSGVRTNLFGTLKKDLTISIPESASISDITVNSVAAGVKTDKITSDKLMIKTASGNVDSLCTAKEITIKSASGSIVLNQTGNSEQITAETASGKIESTIENTGKGEFRSASGKIGISAKKISELYSNAVSGNITLKLDTAPNNCSLRTVSGDINLDFSKEVGFTASTETLSGKFSSDLAMKTQAGKYIYGDGSADLFFKTTSGNISVNIKSS